MKRILFIVLFFFVNYTVTAQNQSLAKIVGDESTSGTGLDKFGKIAGITTDAAGNLYVSDALNNRVTKWLSNGTSGGVVAGGNGAGTGNNQLSSPADIKVVKGADNKDYLYVADAGNNRVMRWEIGQNEGSVVVASEPGVKNIFINSLNDIYTCSETKHIVRKYNHDNPASGIPIAGFNTETMAEAGEGSEYNRLSFPGQIYVDPQGNVFIADQGNGRIMKYVPSDPDPYRGKLVKPEINREGYYGKIKFFGFDKSNKLSLIDSYQMLRQFSYVGGTDPWLNSLEQQYIGTTGIYSLDRTQCFWIDVDRCISYIATDNAVYKKKIIVDIGVMQCTASSKSLYANDFGDKINWYRSQPDGGYQLVSSNNRYLYATEPGFYCATRTNECYESEKSKTIEVGPNNLPAAPIIQSSTGSFDLSVSGPLTLNVVNAQSGYSFYWWNRNNTSLSLPVSATGVYGCSFSQGSCGSSTRLEVTSTPAPIIEIVNPDAQPLPPELQNSDIAINEGIVKRNIKKNSGYIKATLLPDQTLPSGAVFVWYKMNYMQKDFINPSLYYNFGGTIVSEQSSDVFYPQESGLYVAAVKYPKGHLSKYSDTIRVFVADKPPVAPVLAYNSNVKRTYLCGSNENGLWDAFSQGDNYYKVFFNGILQPRLVQSSDFNYYNRYRRVFGDIIYRDYSGFLRITLQAVNATGQSLRSKELIFTGDISASSPQLITPVDQRKTNGNKPALLKIDPYSYKSNFQNVTTQWYTEDGSLLGLGNEFEFQIAKTGKYYVMAGNECGVSQKVPFEITAIPPLAISTTKTSLCFSDNTSITVNRSNPVYWFKNNISVGQSLSYDASETGDYYASEYSDGSYPSNTITISKATANVDVPIVKVVQPYISDPQGHYMLKEGGSITLSAPDGYTSYLWSKGTNTQFANTQSITITEAGTYRVTVSNGFGCSAISAEYIIDNLPTISISSDFTEICDHYFPTLSSNVALTWNINGWNDGRNSPSQTFATTKAGQYNGYHEGSYSYVENNNVSVYRHYTDNITITTCPANIIDEGPLTPCPIYNTSYLNSSENSTFSFTISESESVIVSATNPYSQIVVALYDANYNYLGHAYSWGSNAASFGAWLSPGTYYVETSFTTVGVTGYVETIVRRESEPELTTPWIYPTTSDYPQQLSTTITCKNQFLLLSAPEGYASYKWSTGEETSQIYVNEPGDYFVTVSNGGQCSKTSEIKHITSEIPVVEIQATGNTDICQGNTVKLESTAGFSNYVWSNGATGPVIYANETASYSVKATNSNGCTAESNAIVVTVNSILKPDIKANSRYCQGDNAILEAPEGYATYLWKEQSTGATIGNNRTVQVNASGNYMVTVINASGCSSTSDAKAINILPVVSGDIITSGPTEFCAGGSVTLTAPEGNSWLWSNGAKTQSITVTNSEMFYVTVYNANGCSFTTPSKQVQVKPISKPSIAVIGSNLATTANSVTVCPGTSIGLSATNGFSKYEWFKVGSSTIISTNRAIIVQDFAEYQVKVTNFNGCTSTSDVMAVIPSIAAKPVIVPSGPTSICKGNTVTLTAPDGYANYEWTNREAGPDKKSVTVSEAGDYYVTVTNASGCTSVSDKVTIVVKDLPLPPAISTNAETICPGGQAALAATGGQGEIRWFNSADEFIGTGATFLISIAGDYYAKSFSGNCYSNDRSNTISIEESEGITTPVISKVPADDYCNTSVKLTTNSPGEIKWYRGIIPVGKGGTFKTLISGTYTAIATNSCGSSPRSNAIVVKLNPALKVKESAFDDISYEIPPLDFDTETESVKTDLVAEITESCEAQAQNWMAKFKDAGLSEVQQAELKAKLIAICTAGGDLNHMNGSSNVPSSNTTFTGLRSFAEVIKTYTTNNQFTAKLNPWLLDSPYPYDAQPRMSDVEISSTDAAICQRLATLRQECGNPATDEDFYACLDAKYKDAIGISLDAFKILVKSCAQCKYLLEESIPYPIFLDPNAKGCISKTEFKNALDELKNQVPDLIKGTDSYSDIFNKDIPQKNNLNPAYEENIVNFLNQKWGFATSFAQYAAYAALADNTTEMLCTQPVYPTIFSDLYDDVRTKIDLAVAKGQQEYSEYIPELRKKAMLAYTDICGAAKANVSLKETQKVYHYTLYYYDQADNLITTVPPEGVKLLTTDEVNWVADAREHRNDAVCTKDALFPLLENKTKALRRLTEAFSNGNQSMEMWMYNPTTKPAQLLATSPAVVGGEYGNKFMLHTAFDKNKLNLEIFTLEQNAANPKVVDIIRSNQAVLDLSPVLPLNPWIHLVVQSVNFQSGELNVYVNGKLLSAAMGPHQLISGWEVLDGSAMPEKLDYLKYLRTYNRGLTVEEIAGNYTQSCFMLADKPELKASLNAALIEWCRFNIPTEDSETLAGGVNPDKIENRYTSIYPDHALKTMYAYNTTNQVLQQKTPDAGLSKFWYDDLSRLIVSQNAQQKDDKNFSYTQYDDLGRIKEVGQKHYDPEVLADTLNAPGLIDPAVYAKFKANTDNSQITQTLYDEAPAAGNGIPAGLVQNNLRKRVAASIYRPTPASTNLNASYYNYDISGNVKSLVQQIDGLGTTGTKTIDYEYDLVSGKVNFVAYQNNQPDRFFYEYEYDAENRLIKAYSGISAFVNPGGLGSKIIKPSKKLDAEYQYYLHGPLARVQLGAELSQVQGIDYAYTLQGWLKGVNGQALNPETEIGKDGITHSTFPKDVMAYSLGYYKGDYKAINPALTTFGLEYQAQEGDITGHNLYNGNISNTTVAISKLRSGEPSGYTYKYDQLNRLKEIRYHHLSAQTAWNAGTMLDSLKESITYDGNGNILTYLRNGNGLSKPMEMDKLSYAYNRDKYDNHLLNNRLRHVKDEVAIGNYIEDLDSEGDDNYTYDKIGNLVKDVSGQINKIDWTVYGKIDKITKTDGTTIDYCYDAAGNRVSKNVNGLITWYTRDAQGNSLAVYDNKGGDFNWKEQQLYGSSRLGTWKPEHKLGATQNTSLWDLTGKKNYELSNHLGNVLAVVSDKRTYLSTTTDNYEADVVSAQDYYPGGMLQPGRSFSSGSYRYGFNGKENDNEVKKDANGNEIVGAQQDYGMRIYDPRLGKFLSVDPLTKDFPWYTPYQYAGNSPISNLDLDGAEDLWFMLKLGIYGKTSQTISTNFETGVNNSIEGTYNFFKPGGGAYKLNTYKQMGLFLEEVALSSSPVSNVTYKPKTPRLDASVKSFNDNVINGDLASRSRFAGGLVANLATSYALGEGFGLLGASIKKVVKSSIVYESFEGGATYASFKGKDLGYYEFSESKGLQMDLNVPAELQGKGLGTKIFKEALKTTKADKFTAKWIESSEYANGSSINLQRFYNAIKNGASETEAAWSTWSGGQAQAAGFNKVTVQRIGNGVEATFTK